MRHSRVLCEPLRTYHYDVTLPCLQKRDSHAHAPRFPKAKDEGWFLVLGDVEQYEVVALKRVGYELL